MSSKREVSYADIRRIAALEQLSESLRDALLSGQPLFVTPTPQQRRLVDEHNARVLAELQRVADARQARVNAREIAKVRKAMCETCFTVLPASGACGNCC